ncbi:hypothetical protein I4U23_023027 [Adineta vaga]|nr:hypothetical protein I4U23_023027 [Adineta vaga]
MKIIVLNNIATDLSPADSSPQFGIYFFGGKSAVQKVLPFGTTSSSAMKSIVFSTAPDIATTSRLHELESHLFTTNIIAGIATNNVAFNQLATHPSQRYTISFSNIFELIVSTPILSALISAVPVRAWTNQVYYGNMLSNVY